MGEGVELSSPNDTGNHNFSLWRFALWPGVNKALKITLKINDGTYELNGKHVLKCFVGLAHPAPLQDGAPTDIPYTGNQAWKALVSQPSSHAVHSTLQAYLTADEIILMLVYCSKKKQMWLNWCWKLSPQNISRLQMLKCTEVANIKVHFKDLQLIQTWYVWYYICVWY